MKKALQGLLAIAAVMSLFVIMGAGRSAADASGSKDAPQAATEKAVRTAGVDVAIGSFTCRGQTSNGEVSAGIVWQGTSGVVASSSGLGISITTVVSPPPAAAEACIDLTDGLVMMGQSLSCTVSAVRTVGVTQDLVVVCSGITDDTNVAVANLTRYIAANVRVE